MGMSPFANLILSTIRFRQRLTARFFALAVGGAFHTFGKNSVIMMPVRLSGESRISIGHNVYIGSGSWLQTLPDELNATPALEIGNGTSMSGYCVLSAARRVILEENVLLARNVYISDHIHRYTDLNRPIKDQGVDKVEPVLICTGAWLGQNVVICPGVRIGKNAVIGANSVVNTNVPDYGVAVGAPARVIKNIAEMA